MNWYVITYNGEFMGCGFEGMAFFTTDFKKAFLFNTAQYERYSTFAKKNGWTVHEIQFKEV